jgi:hypothetical protein
MIALAGLSETSRSSPLVGSLFLALTRRLDRQIPDQPPRHPPANAPEGEKKQRSITRIWEPSAKCAQNYPVM